MVYLPSMVLNVVLKHSRKGKTWHWIILLNFVLIVTGQRQSEHGGPNGQYTQTRLKKQPGFLFPKNQGLFWENMRNFLRAGFLWGLRPESTEFHFKKYQNFLKIRARKFYFLKYKDFFGGFLFVFLGLGLEIAPGGS